MQKWILFIALVSFNQFIFSQKKKLGEHIKEELEQKEFSVVTDENAVFLLKNGIYGFTISGEAIAFTERYHNRLKILKDDGKKYADIKIRYDQDQQDVRSIKAFSYNLVNGKVEKTKVKNSSIFRNKTDDETMEVTFAIPKVKVGTIIEYQYEIVSKERSQAPTWFFDSKLPTVSSQLNYTLPEWYTYSILQKGNKTLAKNDSFSSKKSLGVRFPDVGSTEYLWRMTDIKPYKGEDFVGNIHDYRNQIQFRLRKIDIPGVYTKEFNETWQSLNQKVSERYNDFFRQSKDLKLQTQQLIEGANDDEEKIKRIFNFVTKEISIDHTGWVYPSKNAKKVFHDKSATNVAEANLLLINLLNLAKIDAKPLLVGTREDGYISPLYATLQHVTYPVAYIKLGDKEMLLNATSKYRPYSLSRYSDYNIEGLLLGTKAKWIKTEELCPLSVKTYSIDGKIDENGSYSGHVRVKGTNFFSQSDRASIADESVEERLKELVNDDIKDEITFSNFNKTDLNENYKSFSFEADFTIEDYAQVVNESIYINPFLFGVRKENPFTDEERNYPVDFPFPYVKTYSVSLNMPEGYTLKDLPKPSLIKYDKNLLFKKNIKNLNGKLIIVAQEKIKKTIYMPNEYAYIKEYSKHFINEMNNQITITKE